LDRLAVIHWQRASDPASAAILLRIADRRAALFGYDAPIESRVMHVPAQPAPEHDLSQLTLDELRALRDLVAKVERPAVTASTNEPLLIEQQQPEESEPQS
jgi:hypothetical protein